jgi:hypothetical protein
MLHQAEEERQVTRGDPLLIKREDKVAALGAEQEIGVFDAFRDALKESSAPRS